jgi:hypothetical protein
MNAALVGDGLRGTPSDWSYPLAGDESRHISVGEAKAAHRAKLYVAIGIVVGHAGHHARIGRGSAHAAKHIGGVPAARAGGAIQPIHVAD